MNKRLIYKNAASSWYEALPLGSGSLGAMIEGTKNQTKLHLNLDTLWSGYEKDKCNPSTKRDLSYLRTLLEKEEYEKAEDYAKEHYLGDWTECYLPAAKLVFDFGKKEKLCRELYLETALYKESFNLSGIACQISSFIHYDKDILCLKIEAEKEIAFNIFLDAKLKYELKKETNTLILCGQAPEYAAPNYYEVENPIRYGDRGMHYALALRWKILDGSFEDSEKGLYFHTKNIEFYLAGETEYKAGKEFYNKAKKWEKEKEASFANLYEEHKQIFKGFYNRFSLDLYGKEEDTLLSLENLSNNGIYELMFGYARYLMLASSKEGTQAANLQGIWNELLRAPWSSNYTVNINTQMNYWFVEAANLSECHLPLFDLLEKTVKNGEKTAKKLYGLDGFVSHHNIDIWGHSTPVGLGSTDAHPCVYSMWNMSGAWLCRHLTQHYRYTKDANFLRERAFPIIEKAVIFFLGYLYEYEGYLLTSPSTSPENLFLDDKKKAGAMSIASTMDISILKELFRDYLYICDILGYEKNTKVEESLAKLPDFKISKHKTLQEWFRDYEEEDINHRHVSHLYGLYPGDILIDNENLKIAVKNSLNRRQDEGTGWCIAWKACLFARLGDGNRSLELLNRQLRLTKEERILTKGGGTYPNLFCAHPPFQIDGNFGFAAAMLEMLIFSKEGEIKLLPALPSVWKKGKVSGIKAVGNYEIAFSWEDYQVKNLSIKAKERGKVRLVYNNKSQEILFTDEMLEFVL